VRQTDDRPAAGAAVAATGGAAAVDEALDLISRGIGRLAKVDATTLPEGCVTDTVRRLGALDGRVEGIQARFVAAAEAAGVPQRSGASSTTSWLAQHTGRSGGQAARTTRLAKTTESTPELTDAVANGEVGPDQANTIAAGLERDELDADDVAELLPAARRQTPSMVDRQARQLAGRRRQQRLRKQELIARDERHHRQWRTANGSLRYEGLLPPAEGDRMEKAISGFYQPDSSDVPHDQRRSHAQRSADAMTGLLEAALRSGEAGDVGGVRPHISVVTPIEAMAPLRDAQDAGITAVTDTGTVLSAAAFNKLACDATVRRLVVDSDGQPLDIGRATRQWPAAIRAAIAAIDGGCRGPGCDLPPHRCIVHHIRWWRDGGETSTSNGAMQCNHHHDLIHDHGWTLQMDPATRRCTWTAPDGTVIVTDPYGPAARSPAARDSMSPRPATTTAPGAHDEGSDIGSDAGSNNDASTIETISRSAGPQRPLGRGDPGRPRSPGADPPPAPRDRGDRTQPGLRERDTATLQLDL